MFGLVGENGSGKSTLLKLIAGLIRTTRGTVTVNEIVTRKVCEKVAYLSEREVLYDFLTVGGTIDFFASQFQDFDMEKAHHILQFMNLQPEQRVKHLLKGTSGYPSRR